MEHVTSRVSGDEVKINQKKPNPNPNPNYLLLFFIIKFVPLSWFLRLYHFYGLFTVYLLYDEEFFEKIVSNVNEIH